jgi:hypothetical protein
MLKEQEVDENLETMLRYKKPYHFTSSSILSEK